MQEPYENLIAQAHNGSGKTVAFALGSLSHVDPYVEQLQVICIAHSRELIIQNYDVYKKISKGTGIRVNVMLSYKECPQLVGHVLIATPSTLEQQIRRNKVDVLNVKCLVIDEADLMFDVNSNNLGVTTKKLLERMKPPPQVLCFSATYCAEVRQIVEKLVPSANKIQINKEELTLT